MGEQDRIDGRESGAALVTPERAAELKAHSVGWPSAVVAGARLSTLEAHLVGALPAAPFEVEVPESIGGSLEPGAMLALRDGEGVMLAALEVRDVTHVDGIVRASGDLEGLELPVHHDFVRLRRMPADVAAEIHARGWARAIAYVPGPVMHAGHRAALAGVARELDAGIVLMLPVEGGEPGGLPHFARVHAWEVSARQWPPDLAVVVIVPFGRPAAAAPAWARMADVARRYGCSHLAVDDESLPAAVRASAAQASGAAGVGLVALPPLPHTAAGVASAMAASREVPAGLLTHAEVEALERVFVPRHRQGLTVFFTGLSGSGKSTIANALRVRLMETTGRAVTSLDGDLVRQHLSSELGFSREHRDLNILRIGWVASEITRHGGIAVCAPIAPYDAIRRQVRAMVEPAGGFVLVHVATPLAVCEARDRKGLYARARAGIIPQFTGVSDPYEAPDDAALTIDTSHTAVDVAVEAVMRHLASEGYVALR